MKKAQRKVGTNKKQTGAAATKVRAKSKSGTVASAATKATTKGKKAKRIGTRADGFAGTAFVIDRAKWVCGDNSDQWDNPSSLLNTQGNMCCLGQIMSQCGFHDDELRDLVSPAEVVYCAGQKPGGFLTEAYRTYPKDGGRVKAGDIVDTTLAQAAMYANDTGDLSLREREAKLKELFASHDVKLTFKGKLFRI